MTSTLALLGFLALTFLLVWRASMACQGRSRQTEQEPAATPPEQSDTLVPVRQV